MEYYSLNQYLKDTFGQKVYKIALDVGFTCPNRDGTLDTRGCIFCSGRGSGDFSGSRELSVYEQIEKGKRGLEQKIKNGKYIAYFQAFTNTYAPVGVLRKKYEEAVSKLKAANITTIVHVILGLPGESRSDMLKTVDYVGKSEVSGIKLQLLHVIRGTDLAKEYENGSFETLSLDEYVELVSDCIAILPKNMVIHRMTGDGDKKTLIAPLWSGDKKNVLNRLNRAIANHERIEIVLPQSHWL